MMVIISNSLIDVFFVFHTSVFWLFFSKLNMSQNIKCIIFQCWRSQFQTQIRCSFGVFEVWTDRTCRCTDRLDCDALRWAEAKSHKTHWCLSAQIGVLSTSALPGYLPNQDKDSHCHLNQINRLCNSGEIIRELIFNWICFAIIAKQNISPNCWHCSSCLSVQLNRQNCEDCKNVTFMEYMSPVLGRYSIKLSLVLSCAKLSAHNYRS